MRLVRLQRMCLAAMAIVSVMLPSPASGQEPSENAPSPTISPPPGPISDSYSGAHFLLVGGPMFAAGRGSEALKTRASGSLVVFEFGSLSPAMGTGFTFEMRVCNWAWLPNRPEARVRLGMVTVGARFHILTLFRTYVEMIHDVQSVGPGLYRLGELKPVESSLEYLGVGAFARADALSWTYVDNGNTDPTTPYDPFVEAGMFLSLASSVEWLGGLEISAGGAASKSSGSMLFLRVDAKMFGHARRGDSPFNKVYLKRL